MVSRRNFFTISMIMLVVLFMFQIPEIAKDRWNNYGKNEYDEETGTGLMQDSVYEASAKDAEKTGRFVIYIGDTGDGSTGSLVRQWCLYTKRYLEEYKSVGGYRPGTLLPEAVLIDSAYLSLKEDLKRLKDFTDQGINLIFCNLPKASEVDRCPELKELLGIRSVIFESTTVEGIRVLDGFLLGGLKEYKLEAGAEKELQDFPLELPWYLISSGTKTYMAARVEAENNGLKNESLPALIWRNSMGNAQVFAVNGDYLSGNSGLGILSGMMAETDRYDIYPVVNAQSLVIADYPMLSSENEEEMIRRYSRSLTMVDRDIVWPELMAVAQRNSLKMTCMLTTQTDYGDEIEPDAELLIYYMKLLQEQEAEAGVSGNRRDASAVSVKVGADSDFLKSVIPEYAILSFYQGNMSGEDLETMLSEDGFSSVRTIYKDFSEQGNLIAYSGDNVTLQSGVNSGFSHTFREDFRQNSILTALGYSSIVLDANRIAFPESDEDSWEKLSERFSSYTNTYWKVSRKFDGTTLAESDARIRRFLALNYTQHREENRIYLDIDPFDKEAWFILRTHGEELTEAQGASFEKLEENAYLVYAYESRVTLSLDGFELYYYYEG